MILISSHVDVRVYVQKKRNVLDKPHFGQRYN